MIPVYIFYSMFGFQRTGDSFWAAADQMARGFVLGATAGRTTLTGEGLQHADGHSQLLASTNPAVVAYDPAFAYEIAVIVADGLRRMYAEGEDIFYYLTLYNENYPMPAMPPQPVTRRRRGVSFMPAAYQPGAGILCSRSGKFVLSSGRVHAQGRHRRAQQPAAGAACP